MIVHTTLGLYPNNEFIVDGVNTKDLDAYVNDNILNTPDRALFVNGKLIYRGIGITDDQINNIRKTRKEHIKEIVTSYK